MNTTPVKLVTKPAIADARAGVRHVFVRDLLLNTFIGVHAHEKEAAQRVRINLDLAVFEGNHGVDDRLENVVCYEEITNAVRAVCAQRHVNLVETLAETVAGECLARAHVRSVRVRIEKLDVFADVASVGVEIERFNPES